MAARAPLAATAPRPAGGSTAPTTTRVVVPRAGTLEFERDRATGALLAVRGGGRTYLTVGTDGSWHWQGICTTREQRRPDGMSRYVDTPHGSWREDFRWKGQVLTEVDGVEVRRDPEGRVVACVPGGEDPAPPGHRWVYGHDERGVVHVGTPTGTRSVALAQDGRVRSLHQHGVTVSHSHDAHGHRLGPGRPLHDHVDDAGRCWATLDTLGEIRHVFVWDGTRCLARIDGAVGEPLSAVFSLDPSATPVRVVTPSGVVRVPRDAYGEGLLAHSGVPGLFGGQVHGGLVHLPLRRLDPHTGSFCEPDPCDGRDEDPRRRGWYDGPLPAELEPRSAYEVCRGDPVGRADPTGGVSAGLVISDLTWSFQNNLLSFFGIDWWFNLFASLIVAPFKNVPSSPIEYDFFSSTGLTSSERLGSFGVRRGGIINAITGGRAFTTQHIVWSPDSEYALLEQGEVVDPGGTLELTHYGTILAVTPSGRPRRLLQSMNLPSPLDPLEGSNRTWVSRTALPRWSRHGDIAVPVAPGTLTPWSPSGGIHLDTPLTDARGRLDCTLTELAPAAVAIGDLEDRSFLTAPSPTGLIAGDRVLVEDGTNLAITGIVATVAAGSSQRVQLDTELDGLAAANLSMTGISAAPVSSESRAAGAVAASIDVHGTTATYAVNDLLRLTASGAEVTVARVARLEARLPLDRPLPGGFTGPMTVTRGAVGAGSTAVTVSGSTLDFGPAARPAVGSTGLVSGGGTDVAVRIESHTGSSEATIDVALPASVTSAADIGFRSVNTGTVIGSRAGEAEPDAFLTYTPTVAGVAPDGSTGTVVVRCDAGGIAHARVVAGAPTYDVAVLDRSIAGDGPFTTERFTPTGSTVRGLTRADVTGLVVPDPGRFAGAPAVFLTRVTGDPPSPAGGGPLLSTADVAGGVLTTTSTALTGRVEPGQPLLVGSRAAAVRTVRVTVSFAGAFDLASTGLRLVGLAATGHAYLGTVSGADEVLVEPVVTVGGNDVPVPFPRLAAGDLVRVAARTGAGVTWHRVGTADSGRLRLVDGPALTVGDLVVVSHVGTTDPLSGSPYLAIDGTRTGTGPTSTATFSVWAPADLAGTTAVGIVDGEVTHPTTLVPGSNPTEITFSESFDSSGVAVSALDRLSDRFVTALARDGGVLLLEGAVGNLVTTASESIVAVAYEPVGAVTTGTIGPGTLLVPEGEDTEVDRSQSLTDHELTHTLQYARWGPLWFNIFPMLAMELPGILATDTELPEFSRFLDGTVATGTGSRWDLTISDTTGVAIAKDDELQVVQGSRRARVKVTAVRGTVFEVRATESATPAVGRVSVRKQQRATDFDRAFAFFDLLTHGGLLNVLAGTTWGGIFWLLGKGVYGLGRAIAGTGDLYPATVQAGGGALTLSNEADTQNIRAEGRVIVRQGNDTVVRSMTRAGTVVTLQAGVTFTGDVQVAMYDTHDPGSAFDWRDYHHATADADNPFVIDVAAADGSLSLSPEDRVTVRYRDDDFNTDVLAVTGTVVELLDAVPVRDGELSLRIAKIGASDPLGNADSAAMVEMGMGWMKWIFDPYGQIEYAAAPREEWAHWLLRVMRWLLGTQNFSLLPGGYLWWGRLIPLIVGPEEVTPIEQEASEESGDLYTPLARVLGQREDNGFARHRMVVGDIVRYRYWPGDRHRSFVVRGRLERPGIHYNVSDLRALPNRDPVGDGSGGPDWPVSVGSAPEPGTFVAEPFTVRDTDPRVVPPADPGLATADPLGFRPSQLGSVPVGARVQRMASGYVAFTRPGEHRLTTVNVAGVTEAVDASNRERQRLFFDVTADDVTVTAAGLVVDLTDPGNSDHITMVPFQRAEVTVGPNGSRTYRLTVPDPAQGAVRTEDTLHLVGTRSSAGVRIPVEVSRLYVVTDGRYGPGGLAFAGMHLSRDVHIPVRHFTVEVVETLPLRRTHDRAAAGVTSLARGDEAFLLVPAPIVRTPTVTSIAGTPPAAGAPSPVTRVDAEGATATFLGTTGAAFRVRFPADSPTGELVITVVVGTAGRTAELTTRVALT